MTSMEIERPVFFEGQILAAADLTATVEHERARAARHERMLHDWGIAAGLSLTKVDRRDPLTSTPYVEVTVQPGAATDGTGRDIVVPRPVTLSTTLFRQVNGASLQPGAYYPVVLHGFDDEAAQSAFPAGACGPAGGSTRVAEAFEITFRRIGDAAGLDGQPVPGVSAGPGPADGRVWDVLLGFVQWDDGIRQFTDATHDGPGARRRYAGIRADTVAARGGQLELRPNPSRQAGQVAVVVGGDPPVLAFGVYRGDGTVEERLTVSAKGDVTAQGVISGTLTPGQIRAQSGIATDGLLLPLPPGVTQEQVDRGSVLLHISVTLQVTATAPPAGFPIGPFPAECSVNDSRKLSSTLRWLDTAGANHRDRPCPAAYLVLAIGADSSGAGQ